MRHSRSAILSLVAGALLGLGGLGLAEAATIPTRIMAANSQLIGEATHIEQVASRAYAERELFAWTGRATGISVMTGIGMGTATGIAETATSISMADGTTLIRGGRIRSHPATACRTTATGALT